MSLPRGALARLRTLWLPNWASPIKQLLQWQQLLQVRATADARRTALLSRILPRFGVASAACASIVLQSCAIDVVRVCSCGHRPLCRWWCCEWSSTTSSGLL